MPKLQIPSHLILTQQQRDQLYSLPVSEFTDVKWESQNNAISFLQKHNLILENIQPEHKWKVRYSNKVKGIYHLQCCCGSDMNLMPKKSNSKEDNSIFKIECIGIGDIIDLHKHEYKVEVKSITYHEMEIKRNLAGYYTARFLVDL